VLTQKNPDGSFLFNERLTNVLKKYPETYARHLETHFLRHLRPFFEETTK